jgi:LEA14-like dessication related protein
MLSRLRDALTTRRIAALAVLLVGCLAFFAFTQPSVTGVDNRFGDVNETATVVESDLGVRNPNPIGASLGGLTVDYAVDMNGIRMATGVRSGVSLPRGRSTLPLRTTVANERIPSWWVSHVRNGERTELTVDASVHSSLLGASVGAPEVRRTVETDVLSSFDSTDPRPIGEDPVDGGPLLVVEETSARWGIVDAAETAIEMRFVVHNPTVYPIPVSELGYRATMNGVEMGTGATEGYGVIPPGESRTIRATTTLENANLDEWWVTHLENDQVTALRIDFSARFDLPTGTVSVPLDPLTYRETIETDIFGNDGAATAEADEDDGDGERGDGDGNERGTRTPTSGSTPTTAATPTTATPTPTASPTATATPTPEPTPTDDGLLDGDDGTTTPTPTDDGGLLSVDAPPGALPTTPAR